MGDVVMVGMLVAAIGVFVAYVAGCDRIVGRGESTSASPATTPGSDSERTA